MKSPRLPLAIPLLTLAALTAVRAPSSAAVEKPNFIVINIDDMGYADIGPFGSKINRTPHLDRMAAEGRKLTCFYAAPVCSPSRAALMTGCYPKRVLPIPGVLFPGDREGLHPGELTVAELLRDAGYATACIGKWHLGDQPEFLPTAQGFDYYLGIPYSNDMGSAADGSRSSLGERIPKPAPAGVTDSKKKKPDRPPLPMLENDKVVARVKQDGQQAMVAQYTAAAVKFIKEHRESPFFLYLPHNAIHSPLYPGKEWAGKSPHGINSDWIEEVDWSVGQVLDTLRELKLDTRTLVLFTSDNGGTTRAVNAPLRGHKGSTWEGGMRVPTIAWWPGKIPAGSSTDEISGMFDVLPTLVKLGGGTLPADRKLDGADIWPILVGMPGAKSPHEIFYYFHGPKLTAVRKGPWKLHFAREVSEKAPAEVRKKAAARGPSDLTLYHLGNDIGESDNVADSHPEVVAELQQLADAMDADLGRKTNGPGVRPLGVAKDARPLIDSEGNIRPGFAP